MTKKPTVTTLQSGFNSTETLNTNFEALRDGFDNTLSLDGSTPNAMEADLDLNGNNIIGATGLLINGTDYLADVTTAKTAALAAQAAAETAETNAETAETNAESSETAAGLSATAAATSATASAASAVDATNNGAAQVTLAAAQVTLAETAKTAAELAETNAETAESNASTSATNAATSASTASTEASTASTKASEAATSATNAATSATESETAKTAAEAAKDAALAALDSFDDRYLGAKASDPTLDNDGNALVAGALYYNTTSDVMKVYEGSLWVAAYASLSGALLSTNNLSDLTSAATARTNLGLGTAATSAATDFVAVTGDTMTGDLSFGDSDKALFGAGSDLSIYHDGSNSFINDQGDGDLRIQTNGNRVNIYDQANANVMAHFNVGGTVDLYHNGDRKLNTTSTGVTVTGNARFLDDDKALFGDGNDLQIYHNGTNSVVSDTGEGNLTISSNGAAVNIWDSVNGQHMAQFQIGGKVVLRHNGDTKLETTSTGADVTGTLTSDGLSVDGNAQFSGTVANIDLIETNVVDENTRFRQNAGNLYIQTINDAQNSASDRLRIDHSSGDISFYDDSGDVKFHWDASAERLAIGTNSPTEELEVNGTGDTTVLVKTTGTGDADAILKLDSADSGESVLEFMHDGVSGAKIEWFTDGSPDLNLTTVGATSVIDMQVDGTRVGRFSASGLDVDGTVTATAFSSSTTAGAVGTYVWATSAASDLQAAQFVFGTTYAGTGLYPAGFASLVASEATTGTVKYTSSNAIGVMDTSVSALSGTWRCMAQTPPQSSNHDEQPTALFVRIS